MCRARTLRRMAARRLRELGPFDPPADYAFEPELCGAAPRPIPDELKQGRYARRQRRIVIGLFASGLLCSLLGALPVVRFFGDFVPPLNYLSWIGIGLTLLAIIGFVRGKLTKGPYAYVESGVPIVARVCSLVVRPASFYNGQPTGYQIAAIVQYRDPLSDQVMIGEATSNALSASVKDSVTTTYHVGDYATAVYLEDDPQSSLRLYGFLDLKPGLGLIGRTGQRIDRPLDVVVPIVVLFAFLAVLFGSAYAVTRYLPLDITFRQGVVPFVLGAILLGGPGIGYLLWEARSKRRKAREINTLAVAEGRPVDLSAESVGALGVQGKLMATFAVGGMLLLGGIAMLSLAFAANALLDNSPAQPTPATITEMTVTTHSFLFRHHDIKYQLAGQKDEHTYYSNPQEMSQFANNLAMAQVHEGWLGWKWVKSLEPIVLMPAAQVMRVNARTRPVQCGVTRPACATPG